MRRCALCGSASAAVGLHHHPPQLAQRRGILQNPRRLRHRARRQGRLRVRVPACPCRRVSVYSPQTQLPRFGVVGCVGCSPTRPGGSECGSELSDGRSCSGGSELSDARQHCLSIRACWRATCASDNMCRMLAHVDAKNQITRKNQIKSALSKAKTKSNHSALSKAKRRPAILIWHGRAAQVVL